MTVRELATRQENEGQILKMRDDHVPALFPSLPSLIAILVGWASELPVLLKMNNLPVSQQPRDDDPDIWGVWVGKDDKGEQVERDIDWSRIAGGWPGAPPDASEGRS